MVKEESPQESRSLVEELDEELAAVKLTRIPLLSIAIWGWQGDGKTTSLLTAIQYADPVKDLLGFSLVRERDEISEVAGREEFKNTALLHLARSSTAKIEKLLSRFIDDCLWPDGTDAGSAYLLRVEDAASTRAFTVITDLPGGSYSENDRVAEEVIQNAHAMIVMVAPDRWLGQNLRAKAYKNMVRYRIRRCTQLGVPVGVLVAQSDKNRAASEIVVDALNAIVGHFDSDSPCRVFPVSVIADEGFEQQPSDEIDDLQSLPLEADREPKLLVTAWIWTLVKALARENASPVLRVPVIELEQAARAADSRPASLIELRPVGDFSSLPGSIICPIDGTGAECGFLVGKDDGTLVEVAINPEGGVPRLSNLGRVEDAEGLWQREAVATPPDGVDQAVEEPGGTSLLHGAVFDGELVVGPRMSPGSIWCGSIHDLVRPLPLPVTILAWHTISANLVAGLDSDGRLHLLRRAADEWLQADFLQEFLSEPEDDPFCVYLPGSRVLIAGNGAQTSAVRVEAERFGDRVDPPLTPSYTEEAGVLSSSAGSVASVDDSHWVHVTTAEAATKVGSVHPEAEVCVALGTATAGLVAWLDPDLRLRVAIVGGGGVRASEESLSPQLPKKPFAIQWAAGDKLLAVDLGDETWQVSKLLGL